MITAVWGAQRMVKSRYWNGCPMSLQCLTNLLLGAFLQLATFALTFVCSTHLLPCLKCGMSSSLHLITFYYILLFISITQLAKKH